MKRIPQKTIPLNPEPVVIKIDPKELRAGIVLPKVKYEVQVSVENDQAFNGMILPVPKVLIYYLTHNELMIVSTIIEDTNEHSECASTIKELAVKLRISTPTVSTCLYSLRRAGLLLESPNGRRGAGRTRRLNYEAVQHLNDLVEGEAPGIYTRIRTATWKANIMKLTKEDIKKAYDNQVLEPGHDPAEEEEYD